ncbi:Serine hydrolase FSH [Penicillium vulpinum]|uniref:Serine hydrolase FSH n=1 Tax=Penicillium vulpinum TaxID=29845 RepID=UPI0025482100|nr:Serine hydrolase FSH [Penicillium vulpinum]KAJ5950880.1 Serine hydrolase FSH [Penicillium vulpinum]
MRILMIHGSRQSGELFRAKLQGLEKLIRRALQPGEVEFLYPIAPFRLEPSNGTSELRNRHGEWSWWQSESIDGLYPGLEDGLNGIGSILKDSGPFDGIIGFSQGAAAAAMVASLLEENRRDTFVRLEAEAGTHYPACFDTLEHPPLKFVVSISGYAASHPAYRAFYDPVIRTPMLHFLGSMDTIVDEAASMRLVQSCQEGNEKKQTVIWHSGGHVVPNGKRELAAVAHFIKSTVSCKTS